MSKIDIPAHEHGCTRLFAINRPAQDMSRALKTGTRAGLAQELLGQPVTEDKVEIFPLADLAGVGLPGYLREGHAVPSDQIARDHGKLDALDGYVMLVRSGAFGDNGVTLTPSKDVTLIGTYGEVEADMSVTPMESAAAQPYTGAPAETAPIAPRSGASGTLIVLGLVLLVLIAVWWFVA
jgi:hypothetical protein